jgi:23S rRNA (uracil1939-C5)-methyltransferase
MARHAESVIGVEENPSSIQNAIGNASHNQITNATFIVENVRRFLKFDHTPCTKMIVDPPRDGLIPKVLRRIIERRPSRLIYVSCNPNTLMRDLKLLTESAFEIDVIQPVDMFPNTWHVETIVRLTYRGESR